MKFFGLRDYPNGYDVLTARIVLLGATDNELYSADVTPSRGAEPNGDVDHVVSPARTGVVKVRVLTITAQATGPGLAEIEAYTN